MNSTDLSTLKILVIDNEAHMRTLIIRVLSDLGVKSVMEAEDGNFGLEAVRRSRGEFDIIICDLDMPELDGFGFVKALSQSPNPKHKDIPVLIVSGHGDMANIQEVVKAGIHGFVTKPISRQSLELRLTAALNSPPIDPTRLKK